MVHCWADGPKDSYGMSQTCMLPDKHRGPHRWTRDDQILVTFPAAPKDVPEARETRAV